MTYNILAECHRVKSPEYLEWTSEQYLDMSYRHERIVAEISKYKPQVVCMQEVETKYFTEILHPCLKR